MPAPTPFDFDLFGTAGTDTYHARKNNFVTRMNAVLDDLWAQVMANRGGAFPGRASAVAAGQGALPATLGQITTREGDWLAVRSPYATADDPLFSSSPQWGVILRLASSAVLDGKADLANSGKMFRSREDAVAAGQSTLVPGLGIVITLESGVVTWRVPFQSGDDPLFANSPFWGVVARMDVASAMRDTGVITLANLDGSANQITAELPQAARRNGVTSTSGTSIIEIIPRFTNDGASEPTLSIDGGSDVVIKSESGAALEAGQLVGGRSYLLRRRGNSWRILGGGVGLSDLGALRTEVRGGRVFATSGGNTPSGVTGIPPDYSIDVLIMRNYAARTFSLWLPASAPADGLETENLAKDSNDHWWERLTSYDANGVRTDMERGRTYVQYTIGLSGRTIPASAKGVLSTNGTEFGFWTPTSAPSDGVETETLQKDLTDRWWTRVWLSTDSDFSAEVAFRNPDPTSTTLFQLLKTYAGTAALGFRADGSWAEPTPLGGLRWPGDDLVVFETQAGDPLLAFAPDGTLIAKGI